MKNSPYLILGLFVVMASSWTSLVLGPIIQWKDVQPFKDEITGTSYPSRRHGMAEQGLEIYRSHGCQHCHTINVRHRGLANDIPQGLGPRRTVALDFLLDGSFMPGQVRLGPDLANFGARARAAVGNNTNALLGWIVSKIHNPPGSPRPVFGTLFSKRGDSSAQPFGSFAAGAEIQGSEVEASYQGLTLAHFLMSLDSHVSVFEAPIPKSTKTNEIVVTNQVARATHQFLYSGLELSR